MANTAADLLLDTIHDWGVDDPEQCGSVIDQALAAKTVLSDKVREIV